MDKKNWTAWFEIPATDFHRAVTFYETIFRTQIHVNDFGDFKMGIFPHREVGCAICFGEGYLPDKNGLVVYLNADPDLEEVLDLIELAGGEILRRKKLIAPDHGYMALFIDTEGNRLALHSMK